MRPRWQDVWESSRSQHVRWTTVCFWDVQSGLRLMISWPNQVGAWLAVLRVFLSRTPLSGDRCTALSSAANQAHLRSHSGHRSSSVLCGCPTSPEFQIQPSLFRTIVLERLTEAVCECVGLGCGHRAACPRSGRLRSR